MNQTNRTFTDAEGKVIVDRWIVAIQENKAYLSEIDGAIGDGDHGINMNKGFTLAQTRMEGRDLTMSQAMKELGTILMTEIGGSMGPLYGKIFRNMSKTVKDTVDKATIGAMLHAAVEGVQSLGDAKVGDKTLMDALVPAMEAYDQALFMDKSFEEALDMMAKASLAGRDSTFDMVASIGRASRLGERSRGCLDAGATSCNLILSTMADTIKILIR